MEQRDRYFLWSYRDIETHVQFNKYLMHQLYTNVLINLGGLGFFSVNTYLEREKKKRKNSL